MRRILALVALTLWAVAALAPAPADAGVKIERVESPGGITAWLVRDRFAPIISLSFAFAAGGSADDPAGKEGLAHMVSGLLDEGAGDIPSRAFQEALEDNAIRLSFEAGRDRFSGQMQTLVENKDEAFRLLALALRAPRFDDEPVSRIRAQMIAQRRRAEMHPQSMVSEAWFRTVFPGHPYGRPPAGTEPTLTGIAQSDLAGFTRRWLVRKGLAIGVVGDIEAGELAGRLDQIFGRLPESGAPSIVPDVTPAGAGRVIVLDQAIPQSVVMLGQAGVKRDDPDYYAAYVMNHILGGSGFSARLTEQVREKRGLAYSVYSYLAPMRHAGLLMGGVATRNDAVAESLRLIREEWRKMAENGVGGARLASAKTHINGSFPLGLSSTRRIAGMLVAIQINRLGIDYLDRRAGLINGVSTADIARVARRLLDADGLTVVVAGQPEGIESR